MIGWKTGFHSRSSAFKGAVALRRPPYVNAPSRPSSRCLSLSGSASYYSFVLATKVYFPMGNGPNDRGLSRKHIMEQSHASLRRLGTDYIDLYQCHRYDPDAPLEETLRALDDLVTQGKVLYVGVSEWSATQIADAVYTARELNLDRIVSNQPIYNMLTRYIEPDILPLCEREGIGQIVFWPLAPGVLTGKYRAWPQPDAGTRAAAPASGHRR